MRSLQFEFAIPEKQRKKTEDSGIITDEVRQQLQRAVGSAEKLLPTAKDAIEAAHKQSNSDKKVADLEDSIDEVVTALAPVKQILIIGRLKNPDETTSKMDFLRVTMAKLLVPMKRLHELVQVTKFQAKLRSSKDKAQDAN